MQLFCQLVLHLSVLRVSWKTIKQLRRDEAELEFEILQGEGKKRHQINIRFHALQVVRR